MSGKYDANTTADVLVKDFASSIAGKTILTTGVSPGGLGAYFVEQIAKAGPKLLILAARDSQKLKTTADAVSASGVATKLLDLDLASLEKVRKAADAVNSWSDVPAIDVLVNNAGVMACDFAMSEEDGFEKQMQTNHLGPFLFTNLIMKKVMASREPRIVMVTSDGHRLSPIRWADFDFHKGENYNKWWAYGQSKTANMLMTLSLAEKLGHKGLTAVSLHPGVIGTNLGNHLDWEADIAGLRSVDRQFGNPEGWAGGFNFKDPSRGVSTHVYAAFDPALKSHNGAYLLDNRIADPEKDTVKPWATSSSEAERLWKVSEELVGVEFVY